MDLASRSVYFRLFPGTVGICLHSCKRLLHIGAINSFGTSKVDHFDFCFTFTTQPPTGIILGLPPPAKAPTDNSPRGLTLYLCVSCLVSHSLSPNGPSLFCCPPPPLLLRALGPLLVSSQLCFVMATAASNSIQTYLDAPVSLWSWPHTLCKCEWSWASSKWM